jgi:hypothetical protein
MMDCRNLSKQQLEAIAANNAEVAARRAKAPWNRPAPAITGSTRERESYRQFLAEERAAEAAAEERRMAPVHAALEENQRLLRQLYRAQQQALMTAPDTEIEFDVCKIRPEQYRDLSFDDWKKLAAEGFDRAKRYWAQEGMAAPTAAELNIIVKYFTTNGLLPNDEFAWVLALRRCTEAGLLPDRLERVEAEPKPEISEPEPENPYKPGSREYDKWDRARMIEEASRELSPVFRGAVESLCAGGKEMSADNMRFLFQKFSDSRLPLTVSNVRKVAFSIWKDECLDVMTEDERAEYEMGKADAKLSSDEYLKAHNLGNPRHHMPGPGRLSRSVSRVESSGRE